MVSLLERLSPVSTRTVAVSAVIAAMTIAGLRLSAAVDANTVLAVAGRANANVSLTADGSFVAAVWAASTADGPTDVFASISRDSGATFMAPVRVNSTTGEARASGEQPPRVTLARGTGPVPQVVVLWTAKGANGTVLHTSRSTDGGRTYSSSTLMPGTDAAGNRGWEALAADAKGGVHAVWLDHRRMVPSDASKSPAVHQHGAAEGGAPMVMAKADPVAMAQKSDLYFDTLGDETAPRAIASGVCYCCKTAIAFGRPGDIYLTWRHVYPGSLRDMAFTVSRDGGRTFAEPVRVSEDHWMIEGCPEDGPAMTVDGRGRIHIIWPTVVTEGGTQVKALFYALSTDGRSFTPRLKLPTQGQPNHPQVTAAADGTLIVMWDESGGGSRKIVRGRGVIDSAGRATFTRIPLASDAGAAGVYPKVVTTPMGALAAWTSGQPTASVVRLARLP